MCSYQSIQREIEKQRQTSYSGQGANLQICSFTVVRIFVDGSQMLMIMVMYHADDDYDSDGGDDDDYGGDYGVVIAC